jgi:hypothetical protein
VSVNRTASLGVIICVLPQDMFPFDDVDLGFGEAMIERECTPARMFTVGAMTEHSSFVLARHFQFDGPAEACGLACDDGRGRFWSRLVASLVRHLPRVGGFGQMLKERQDSGL